MTELTHRGAVFESSVLREDLVVGVIDEDERPAAIAALLIGGRSIVAAGTLGSGKTFLVDRVVAALRDGGAEPVRVCGSATLQHQPFGALEAASDPRSRDLDRSDGAPVPMLIVVDDAQHLDIDTIAVLVRAVHSGRATALIALTEARTPSGARESALDDIHELWLSGRADRLELPRLCDHDAERLLDEFAPGDPFDTVTRAEIVWAADGSRTLLRALADAAGAAAAAGRDPLDALVNAPAHGTLATVLRAHVRELDDEELRSLVIIERAPGIRYADAARLVPAAVLDDLRSTGMIHDDGTTGHRLSVNRVLARAADRMWGRERTRAVVSEALDRMIRDGGTWWSRPLARLVADRWLRDATHPRDLAGVPVDLVRRVILDAAREANDRGEAAHTVAYTAWIAGTLDAPAIAVEHRFAQAVLHRSRTDAVPDDPDLGSKDLRRARWLAAIIDVERGERAGPAHPLVADAAGDRERFIDRGRRALDDLRLRDAVVLAEHLRRAPADEADASDRVETELLDAAARAYLGQIANMREALDRVSRLLSTDEARGIDRLAVQCHVLACHTIAGTDDAEAARQLAVERNRAVRAGGPDLASASFAAVFVEVRRGRVREALRELRAARARAPFPLGEAAMMVHLEAAHALAARGHSAEAGRLLSRVELASSTGRVLRHSFAATSAVVAAARGSMTDAHRHAEDAWALSETTDAVMLQLRDLHRLVVLGHVRARESLEAMRKIAAGAETATVSRLVTEAEEAVIERDLGTWQAETALSRLYSELVPHEDVAAPAVRSVPATRAAVLTAREREIALLVRDGLSNRQIAGALFLSVRTVESHIYQARSKVGASTRSELGSALGGDSAVSAPRLLPDGAAPLSSNGH